MKEYRAFYVEYSLLERAAGTGSELFGGVVGKPLRGGEGEAERGTFEGVHGRGAAGY